MTIAIYRHLLPYIKKGRHDRTSSPMDVRNAAHARLRVFQRPSDPGLLLWLAGVNYFDEFYLS
jgi:hypothetical protein